jgi:pheromone shutdown protein TraB
MSSDDVRSDPRLSPEYVERIRSDDGDVVLVGTVHDHPASAYRARTVVERESPTVLALEAPPLSVPLFEHHAATERTPPRFGGEMSAAIQAADTDHVVGIDGPTASFLGRLLRRLWRERASLETIRTTGQALTGATRAALRARLAATLVTLTTFRVAVDTPTVYDTDRDDDPDRQAADERDRVRTATTMLSAFEPPPAAIVRTSTREQYMADRLAALRETGDVVAIVGMAHLDGVVSRLRERS